MAQMILRGPFPAQAFHDSLHPELSLQQPLPSASIPDPRQSLGCPARHTKGTTPEKAQLLRDGLTPLTPSSWEAQTVLRSEATFICCCCHKHSHKPASLSEGFPTPGRMRLGPYKQFLSPHMHVSTQEEIESCAQNEARPAKTAGNF